MMFNGILGSTATQSNVIYTVAAGLTIILSAVYTLRMIQRVFYGETNALTANTREVPLNVQVVLSIIVVGILLIGVYPKPLLNLTSEVSTQLLNRMILK
jgi:NADH-quinone oxidoreductase subunit M